MEQMVMDLILNAGNARSKCLLAFQALEERQFDLVSDYLVDAKKDLNKAHQSQTQLIQDEINGQSEPLTLLMVHAQDHLMNALTIYDLVKGISRLVRSENI